MHEKQQRKKHGKAPAERFLNGGIFVSLEVKDYAPSMKELFLSLFFRYAREDLGDGHGEDILKNKIGDGVFLQNWERGINCIALAFVDSEPAGFAIYQVDSEESDWCKRPGWGFIREFCVVPPCRRKGVGRALAAYAEKALAPETDRFYLTAHDRNAAGFWTACGYRETGEIDKNGGSIMEKQNQTRL